MDDSLASFSLLNPSVSRETIQKLSQYRDFILSAKFNLISKNDKKNIWIRHFHDSIRLVRHIEKPSENIAIIDIGSGAGLPGIPLSLALDSDYINFKLCESSQKKSNFIVYCIKELKLNNINAINSRVENIQNSKYDYIISRAVTKINDLFSISYHLIKKNTIFLIHKGIHVDIEIKEATRYWNFEYKLYEDSLNKGSYIFEVKNLIKSNT